MSLPDSSLTHLAADAKIAARERLIAILRSVRQRKSMYFTPINPQSAIDWLSGLRVGCALAGLEWSPEIRRPALERRGLELRAAWEDAQLAARGLGPDAIVDELLSIEIEMWEQANGPTA